MTNEELEAHFQTIGWTVETIVGQDNLPYIVVRGYAIPAGTFAGRTCDVAIQRTTSVPYQAPAAIHTRPILIPIGQRNTLQSGLGPEWEYWSRIVREQTPRGVVAHIATVLSEV
jgi:hypothetical protein